MKPTDKIERLIKNSRYKATTEAYDKTLHSFLQAVDDYKKQKSALNEPNIWRIIMKSPITKLAAAAVIIIVVLTGLHYFGGSFENVAFAEVMQNIRNARTITWQRVITRDDQELVYKVMVLEPYLMRVELEDGRIWIQDHSQGKTLIMDSKNGRR